MRHTEDGESPLMLQPGHLRACRPAPLALQHCIWDICVLHWMPVTCMRMRCSADKGSVLLVCTAWRYWYAALRITPPRAGRAVWCALQAAAPSRRHASRTLQLHPAGSTTVHTCSCSAVQSQYMRTRPLPCCCMTLCVCGTLSHAAASADRRRAACVQHMCIPSSTSTLPQHRVPARRLPEASDPPAPCGLPGRHAPPQTPTATWETRESPTGPQGSCRTPSRRTPSREPPGAARRLFAVCTEASLYRCVLHGRVHLRGPPPHGHTHHAPPIVPCWSAPTAPPPCQPPAPTHAPTLASLGSCLLSVHVRLRCTSRCTDCCTPLRPPQISPPSLPCRVAAPTSNRAPPATVADKLAPGLPSTPSHCPVTPPRTIEQSCAAPLCLQSMARSHRQSFTWRSIPAPTLDYAPAAIPQRSRPCPKIRRQTSTCALHLG